MDASTEQYDQETVHERLAEESAGLAVAWQAAKDWKARAENAEAVVDRVWAVYRARYENAQTGSETWAEFVRSLGGELHSALTTTESEDR